MEKKDNNYEENYPELKAITEAKKIAIEEMDFETAAKYRAMEREFVKNIEEKK